MDPTDGQTDEALLAAYLAGSAEALNSLILRHQKPLYGYIRSMLPQKADADDLFQEVWMRVMKKAARYRKHNFRGWLMRIARNLVIDRQRRKKPLVSLDAQTRQGTAMADLIPSSAATPRRTVGGRDAADFVAKRVRELPVPQREVFVLRTEQEMTFKEIALLQSVSINTALGRMHYAVRRLRQELDQWRDALIAAPSE